MTSPIHPQSGIPQKPWEEWNWGELVAEAQIGLRGQGAVVESNRRMVVATDGMNAAATNQQQKTNDLTNTIRWLTWVLVGFGVVQLVLLGVQVGPIVWKWVN